MCCWHDVLALDESSSCNIVVEQPFRDFFNIDFSRNLAHDSFTIRWKWRSQEKRAMEEGTELGRWRLAVAALSAYTVMERRASWTP